MNRVIENLVYTNCSRIFFFFPGVHYCNEVFLGNEFAKSDNIVEEILVYYFIGLVVSRIGSLAIDPLLKKFKVIQFAAYPSFVKAVKADQKIDTLSEMNNYLVSYL